ncbi:LIM domain transcription factor LMO4.2 [Frankliniella fusca]|uniref:LIM domain transcription factor LMO4.2 n=1 Tax=Frankliniella fusca TaxID=407009 RepID=A0AAE1I0Q5_9NEOP|nr:LIM domain transcription factor LMO4.2 [Frankliniella fusca]
MEKLFGNTGACSACGQTIPASEFVMRVGGGGPMGGPGGAPNQPNAPSPLHVFHLKCFSCSKCGSQLVPGDRYHLLGGALVCEQDWHKLMKGGAAPGVPAGPGAATGVRKGKLHQQQQQPPSPGGLGPGGLLPQGLLMPAGHLTPSQMASLPGGPGQGPSLGPGPGSGIGPGMSPGQGLGHGALGGALGPLGLVEDTSPGPSPVPGGLYLSPCPP